MENRLRIGLVGLGSITKKAYMPVLSKEDRWVLVGGYSRTKENREAFQRLYGVPAYDTLAQLAEDCEAVIINASTDAHFALAKFFLEKGIHVLMDKPLAPTVEECERLVFDSVHSQAKLMVNFNRRFAPLYKLLKEELTPTSLLRIVKNRAHRVGPQEAAFTINDDYIHLVDTARWMVDGKLIMEDGHIVVNNQNQLLYANHRFSSPEGIRIETLLHRDAGKTMESIELIKEGKTLRVLDLATLEVQENDETRIKSPSQWDTVEKVKGFEEAIYTFVTAVQEDKAVPSSGMDALATQRIMDALIRSL
ncbi:MAG TPA: virulence factor MviM [Clostridiaceae bacterium]|nr:virulence factor MviM [Clostridiaceae bacterium]